MRSIRAPALRLAQRKLDRCGPLGGKDEESDEGSADSPLLIAYRPCMGGLIKRINISGINLCSLDTITTAMKEEEEGGDGRIHAIHALVM